ncbi:MAG: 2'-5' RNA ligase family protein [Proteobacteria bacterium]|jgi:2'-5' RNA ligase|nr:2'-5' RNA ligase family protein [Pseudomonadota bacterium]
MLTWQQYLEKHGTSYDYSSVQVDIPQHLAKKIIAWGKKHIPEKELYKEGSHFGRENEIHVTILYGLHTSKSEEVKEIVKGNAIKFTLGKISIFEHDAKYDVVKIEVQGQSLHQLNKKLKQLKHTSSFPTYCPHVTLAYVKKGQGKKYIGINEFSGEIIAAKEIIFSSKDDTKVKIKL